MNAPPLRRPARRRVAALTAAAVGAALLAAPGAATAQDPAVDCTAIGDRPSAADLEAALETAVACGVEVLIADHSGPYESFAMTPDGELHRVQTVDPVQEHPDRGPADPTLVEADGTLVQADSPTAFAFSGTATDEPLMRTRAATLDWDGTKPVPSFSGSTAVYEGLAEGVDLAAEARLSTSILSFTVADAEAWPRLTASLRFTPQTRGTVYQGTLYAVHEDGAGWEQTTQFTVRDADGALHTAAPSWTADAVTLGLDQAILDAAAFPLTVSTEWTYHRYDVSEWGAVTSASPELGLFRGRTGLDQPYFAAAGQGADAVVGAYCDALADPECTAASEAAVYWNFWGPTRLHFLKPSGRPLSFTETAETFSVAAAGTDCLAPDLHSSQVYRPSTTWAVRPLPAVTRAPATGRCQDGRAVYDLTGVDHTTTLSMHPGAESARFDGGSARLETYYALTRNYTVTKPVCSSTAAAPKWQNSSTVTYGDFSAQIWRPDLIDPGLTWEVSIKDATTGDLVFATDPAAVADGDNPRSTVALQDGTFAITHRFASRAHDYETTSTCYVKIDTAAPDLIDIKVPEGPHYIWDEITVEVTVADEGFPDGVNSLTVGCYGVYNCWPTSQTLTATSTATFALTLEERTTTVTVSAKDKAGNRTQETFTVIATQPGNDYDLDGHQDLITVRKSDGTLMYHAGKGDGTFKTAVARGTGWNKMDVVMAGDLTGDRLPDLLARDTRNGYLYTYPGNGAGGFGARFLVGSGWNAMSDFTAGLDYDGNGTIDLIALSERTSALYFYPGDGHGKFGAKSVVETGWVDEWSTLDNLTTIGNVSYGTGTPDLLAWYGPVGGYLVFYTDGEGGIEQTRSIEDDLTVGYSDDGSRYSQVVGGGDYTGDGWNDIYAVNSRTGQLVLRSYDQNLFEMTGSKAIASDWGGTRLPVADSERDYDYYSDGANEVYARNASNRTLYHYSGDGTGRFQSGSGGYGEEFKGANLIETAGDFNGDGHNDLIARAASNGDLYAYPGTSQGGFDYDARIKVGTGWNSMSAVVSGHDFNGDGRVDLLAREKSTGYLWLYPGNGAGKVGPRVKIGSGWNGMRDITAVGDLDHDRHADLLAIRNSDGCLYFYPGKGSGGLEAGVKLSCGWNAMDQLTAVGDFDNDGHHDFMARRSSDGALILYKGNGAGGFPAAATVGSGWNAMDIIA